MNRINHDYDFDWEANCLRKGYEDYQVIHRHRTLNLVTSISKRRMVVQKQHEEPTTHCKPGPC